ncbi:MAG: SDR family NAD(P)-dependent oxidoreductase [Pseudomonadota bacterium]|nr:SDR family NAD(P)-dependent oxidoreductase [Pseudomonadota bacterium]
MKTICITGANRGIGLALATLYSKNHQVIAVCREDSVELKELQNTNIITGIDINDYHCRESLVDTISQVDILILNAGILESDQDNLEAHEKSVQHQIQTNAISPLILAKMSIPKLSKSAKIMLMTSRMGSQDDNLTGGLDGYRMSKAALNTAGCNLAIALQEHGISVFLVHPGYIRTDMTDHQGRKSPIEAADNILKLLDKLTIENTGQFWHSEGYQLPW